MSCTLITGADGYIGLRIVKKYLEETDDSLILFVRAKDQDEIALKRTKIQLALGAMSSDRVRVMSGDLSADDTFHAVDSASISKIVHTAAIIRFNVDSDSADRVNREGAAKIFKFARSCKNLRRLSYVSTIYTSGLATGPIEETRLSNKAGFSNHYERSKWEAEEILISEYSDLPWQIHRMATAICDDDSGRVTQYNAVHNTLKLFYYGLISLLPGIKTTPLYFVTGDFSAKTIFRLTQEGKDHSFYHIAHKKSESLRLTDMIDIVFKTYDSDPDFKQRRILRPLFVDFESFERLSGTMENFGGEITASALATVTPFARQLFIEKDVRNDHTVQDLNGTYSAPDMRALLIKISEDLTQTKWGRFPDRRENSKSIGGAL